MENTGHQIPAAAVPRKVGFDSWVLFPSSRRNSRSCSFLLQVSIFQGISVSRKQLANNLWGFRATGQAQQEQTMAGAPGTSSLLIISCKASDKLLLSPGLIHPV